MSRSHKWFASLLAGLTALPLLAVAQSMAPARSSDPVAEAFRATLKRMSNEMVAAAKEMPADKYSFKPTPESMSFGQLILHISTSNEGLCATISGAAPAPKTTLTADSNKDDLVNLLQSSFDYCTDAVANLGDADLGKMVGGGRRQMSQAAAIMAMSDDWSDHYSQQAAYLRLNGLLPPTAQPGRGRGMRP